MTQEAETKPRIKQYQIENLKIDDLKFDKTNPNQLNQQQMHALRESMSKFGYLTPVIVDQNNLIADGEHRVLVYKEFGLTEIPGFKLNLETDIDRRMLRQVMNKLRGQHDLPMDALELQMILESGENNLKDLSELLAQDSNVLKRIIEEYTPGIKDYKEIDGVAFGNGSIAANWGVPPFSVLDRRTETWQKRRKQWIDFGIASEQGREDVLLFGKHLNIRIGPITKQGEPQKDYRPTVSVFDPVIAEIMIRWFCLPEQRARIIDPFSGGSVRGIVSSFFSHEYVGLDLNPRQIDANERQYRALQDRMPENHIKPTWLLGDSYAIDEKLNQLNQEPFDFCLTSPPYFHIEHYSDDPHDLNNLTYSDFKQRYTHIITSLAKHMKENTFIAWNVGNARDNSNEGDGFYMNQPDLTAQAFKEAGFKLYNELILVHPIYTLPFRLNGMFLPKRTIPRQHEFIQVFYNGSKKSIPRINPKIVEIPKYEPDETEPNIGDLVE